VTQNIKFRMAEEALLFPSKPLFMVDRSWQRQMKKTSIGLSRNKVSRLPEVSINVINGPGLPFDTFGSEFVHGSPAAKREKTGRPKLLSMTEQPRIMNRKQRAATKAVSVSIGKFKDGRRKPEGSDSSTSPSPGPTSLNSLDSFNSSLTLYHTVPGSGSLLYSVIDPEVKRFENLLSYCQ
jgi:hypothetical protein